jgi:hypothetical protein
MANAGMTVAIVVTLGWHVLAALPTAISGLPILRPAGTGLVVWFAYAVLGVVCSVLLVRGRAWGPAAGLVVCPLLLVGVTVVGLASPSHTAIDIYSWAYASAGWFALVALWRRPAGELIAFFVANVAVALAVQIVANSTDRVSVARLIMVGYGVSILQITILLGSRALTALAGRTAAAQDEQARLANRQVAAQAAYEARRHRFDEVRRTAAGLLARLAGDEVDLADRVVQQDMRVAVSRLRRLIVEADGVPEPLQHELRACADTAERRGVEVDLQAPVGSVPAVPIAVRRCLTEPVIQALANARSRARITVVARADEIVVAVVADAAAPGVSIDADVGAAGEPNPGQLSYDSEGGVLWVQTRWAAS